MSHTPTLRIENLCFSYGKHNVLNSVNLTVESGTLTALLGRNGSGKSTLFRCIAGLDKRYTGEIMLGGKSAKGLSRRESARLISFVPQAYNPTFSYSVFDTVLMGTANSIGILSSPAEAERNAARQALKTLGLWELCDRGFDSLSGGDRQLVLIARSLAQGSPLLIMDEPTSGLDFGNRIRVMNVIRELTHNGKAVLYAEHEPRQALAYADCAAALSDGAIIGCDAPKRLITGELIETLYGVDSSEWT